MVRDREIKAEQAEHAGDEPFSLAQGQVEDEPQGQHQLDRQVRIASLSARCGSPWGLPSGDGCLVEPEDQVTAPFQSSIVLSPVPDPVPCPEALGSVWVWSEGHDGASGLVEADHHLSGRAASSHLAAPTPLGADRKRAGARRELGHRLIAKFVEQLNGTARYDEGEGTCF